MKTMFVKGLYLLVCWMFSFSLTAQTPVVIKPTPEELADNQTEVMTADLSLNGKQKQKVKEINLDYAKKMENFISEKTGWVEAFEAKISGLKAVLTNEQFQKWQLKRASWAGKIKEHLDIIHSTVSETDI